MLRTEGLAKRFGGVTAISDVTLDVPAGSVFALIGPNGAGKSTTINICMNFLRATSGTATVLGVDSRKLGPRELAQIGYVSESRQLPEWMPAGDFFAYCKQFYPAWRDDDLRDLVRTYDLPLDRRLKDLSRGMRVKAALAAALSYRPRLILLDEPFSGLDVLIREQLIESIAERTGECTVFVASHDLAEIETFATHIGYLDQGRIQFVEEMDSLLARFREIEVVLDDSTALPAGVPAGWLNPEQSGAVYRFTDSRYDPQRSTAEIRDRFTGVREVTVRTVPFRSIFLALAKSAKADRKGRAQNA